MLSLTADRTALSPPPLSELSDSEGSSSAAPSPFESPASSRASISAPDSMATSCCKWGCCGAVTAAAKIAQLSGGQSFAALNLSWVLCSAFTWIFHNVLCNFLFRCGCTWNWAGSWDRYAHCFCIFTAVFAIHPRADATFTMLEDHAARGVQRPVVSTFLLAVTRFTNCNCSTANHIVELMQFLIFRLP